jgi:hypothetical protein
MDLYNRIISYNRIFRSRTDDTGLVKLYKCGDATSISTGKREESILIESNIEKVIYDLLNIYPDIRVVGNETLGWGRRRESSLLRGYAVGL